VVPSHQNAVCWCGGEEFIHIITEFTEGKDGSRFQTFSTLAGSKLDTGRQMVRNSSEIGKQ